MLLFQDDYEDEDLDEYEDDFIDDAPIDDPYAKNYSKDIAKIFKYDKRKYMDMDHDDIEESSFSRCMAEEVGQPVWLCATALMYYSTEVVMG